MCAKLVKYSISTYRYRYSTMLHASPQLACDGSMVRDHAWVGVLRMAPALQPGRKHGKHCDGRCRGYGDEWGYASIQGKLPTSVQAGKAINCAR